MQWFFCGGRVMEKISIEMIHGFRIGQAQDEVGGSGCTVIICEEGAKAGVDVRGGAPATRETDLLDPINMVENIHAVMLSGGSAFGLDAAGGAMRYLEERGVGYDMKVAVVPIVCGASLFDLSVGDPKCRPNQEMGYQACLHSETMPFEEGNFGAGTGASIGKVLGFDKAMKSGIGSYAVQYGECQVGAIVAVNACGDIYDFHRHKIIGGPIVNGRIVSTLDTMKQGVSLPQGNTTIGCILTNAKLTKAQAKKIAGIAHDGYAKAITPVHTTSDGDTIFVLGSSQIEVMPDIIGAIATEVVSEAILRAFTQAQAAYGLPAYQD